MNTPNENLWVCHTCEMIGSHVEAKAHEITRGHEVEELDAETSEGIRREWVEGGDRTP
jgi:hypothetical protein